MKKHLSTILLILIFLIGLSLLLYPSFSNWWNEMHSSRVVATYMDQVANMDEDEYADIWNAAVRYNDSLLTRPNQYLLSDEQWAQYNALLNIGDNGVMGYIEIPKIDVMLPIYHGTDEAVLQIAAGHLEWTSLPVGGESSHCVISGHRGLPSARLFTDLDDLIVGDQFMVLVLDELLTYEIDQILIVEPSDTEALQIVEGKDYFTLVTCTPYGINSHRLLVRGHRIDNAEEKRVIRVTADAAQVEPVFVAPVVAAPILFVLLLWLMFKPKRKKR